MGFLRVARRLDGALHGLGVIVNIHKLFSTPLFRVVIAAKSIVVAGLKTEG